MKNFRIRIFSIAMLLCLCIACSDNDDNAIDVPPGDGGNTTDPEQVDQKYLLGTLFSFQKDLRNRKLKESAATTFYNYPMFFPQAEEEWWDNLVEEFAYSGMDYVAANCRGRLPRADEGGKYNLDHGDPTHLTELIAAMKRRGVSDKFKIAIFDDCPASWAAARNMDKYDSYAAKLSDSKINELINKGTFQSKEDADYPVDNLDDIYKYIWDYNLKKAFQTIPKEYQLTFKDRPVIFFWSVNNFLDASKKYLGKLSPILRKIREDFNAEFGVNPFLIVDKAFIDRDETTNNPEIVDAINDWFTPSYTSKPNVAAKPYTVRTFNDVTVGVTVPEFLTNDKISPSDGSYKMIIEADHGNQLSNSLKEMVAKKSQIMLVEGFVDYAENAALWRCIDGSYEETHYDYPNQRINIMRRYSNNPYPKTLRVEAEACDEYYDTTAGNMGNTSDIGVVFRPGNLDIKKCDDIDGGWYVTETTLEEYLGWKELPFNAGISTLKLRYATNPGVSSAKIRFDVDGKRGEIIHLPSTNGAWSTIDAGTVTYNEQGEHDVKLVILGNIDINYFTIVN